MKIRVIPALLACMISLSFPFQSYAADADEVPVYETETADNARSAGLISNYTNSCLAGTKTIYISAKTSCVDKMAEVGFKNIEIQRSSDNVNWTTERTVTDYILLSKQICNLDDYAVLVEGGYYYRIVLEHYAKEDTWWFPEEESLKSTSNSVWVSKT